MTDDEHRSSIPETASINGSFRLCRRLFYLPVCSSSRMPSSFVILRFGPNSRARVQSTAFLHPQSQTRQMTCFSHCGSWIFFRAPSFAEVRYGLFQEGMRERDLGAKLRVPCLRKESPVEKFQRIPDHRHSRVRQSFCHQSWNSSQARSQL